MKDRRPLLYIVLVVMLTLAPVGTMHILWPHFLWKYEPLHSSIEVLGAVAAILLAIILLRRQSDDGSRRLFWIAVGLLGGGILDGFHAVTQPGHGFVLLHSMAVLVAGFGFALVWLPESDRYPPSLRKWVLWAVIAGSTLFGIWTLLFRGTLPVMVQDGEFTNTAKVLNLFSGIFFIVASGRFLLDFHRSLKAELYLFSCLAALFGLASLSFTFSAVWDDAWWFWHAVRLSAYLLVIGLVVRGYLQTASSLRSEITEREKAQEELGKHQEHLEELVKERTAELSKANEELRLSEEKFRSLVENLPVGVTIATNDGHALQRNRASFAMFGYESEEESITTPLSETYVNPQDRERLLELLKRGPVKEFETQRKRKDGTPFWASLTAISLPDDPDNKMISVIIDITERKEAEEQIHLLNRELRLRLEQLEDSNTRLNALNQELEAFSYSVSHDLRAPLRSIDGFSQILIESYGDKLTGESKDYLQRVRAASQHMGILIDDLLRLSRVTRSEMRFEAVDLSDLVKNIADELQKTQPGRRVDFVIAPDLTASGDARLLRIMLENLLGNAWKFTGNRPQCQNRVRLNPA